MEAQTSTYNIVIHCECLIYYLIALYYSVLAQSIVYIFIWSFMGCLPISCICDSVLVELVLIERMHWIMS